MRGQPGPAFVRPGCELDPRIHLKQPSRVGSLSPSTPAIPQRSAKPFTPVQFRGLQ
jgi:hypothetical protein